MAQAKMDDMFGDVAPGTPCASERCKRKPKPHQATVRWVGEGGWMDLSHEMYVFYCECCALDAQLAYARVQARRIADLRTKLEKVQCKDMP